MTQGQTPSPSTSTPTSSPTPSQPGGSQPTSTPSPSTPSAPSTPSTTRTRIRRAYASLFVVCMLVLSPIAMFAQTTPVAPGTVVSDPVQPIDPTTTPTDWYASKAGIIAATIFLVSVLKRALGGVQGISAVPTWLFAVVIAGGLTFAARQFFGTMPGPIGPLLMEILMGAATASGVYEWINNGTKSLNSSAVSAGVAAPTPSA